MSETKEIQGCLYDSLIMASMWSPNSTDGMPSIGVWRLFDKCVRKSWILEREKKNKKNTKLEAIENNIQLIWLLYIGWFSYYLIFMWFY